MSLEEMGKDKLPGGGMAQFTAENVLIITSGHEHFPGLISAWVREASKGQRWPPKETRAHS